MPPSLRNTRSKDSLEIRRVRGEISCAECRRHKLKCDKSIPCSSCVKKGCQALCPNGTLVSGHGSRGSTADTKALHHTISEMAKRIRQLEDALQISHSSVSTVPHPLLSEDLLKIKCGAVPPDTPEDEADAVDEELLDSLGTLSVTDKGTESYIGGPDNLLQAVRQLGSSHSAPESESATARPEFVSYLSKAFPFTPLYLPDQQILAYIEEKLPSYERASALAEAYLENLSWFLRPIDREQIMEELIPDVYRRRRKTSGPSSAGSSQSSVSSASSSADAHVLAVLFAVFACGATADLTLPPWNDEADLYFHLARTALSLKPVFEGSGLNAVQAIALLGAYDLFSCRKNELEGSWKVISLSMTLAAAIGLNRDPAHFKLSPKHIQRRRRTFWELYSIDAWRSICSGRPMTFTPSVIDCEFPEDVDAKGNTDDESNPSCSIWRIRYRFIKEILTEVVSRLGAIRPVKYSEILEMDRKIRDFGPPCLGLTNRCNGPQQHDPTTLNLLSSVQIGLLKDITLLHLHRNFSARAIVEDPENPMRTRFGPSFLSTYRSATSMLRVVREQFECSSPFLMRLWPIWAHALTATVMLGSIATCGSPSAMAPQAYVEFDLAVGMFSKAQIHPLVRGGLPILLGLRERAQRALAKHDNAILTRRVSAPAIRPRAGGGNDKGEFNILSSLGRTVRRTFDGEFGSSPLHLSSIAQTQFGGAGALLPPFVVPNGPYPRQRAPSMDETSSARNEYLTLTREQVYRSPIPTGASGSGSETMSFGNMPMEDMQASRSPLVPQGVAPLANGRPEEREATGPSAMQTYGNTLSSMEITPSLAFGESPAGQVFDPSRFGFEGSSADLDVFDAYTDFSNMAVDSGSQDPSRSVPFPAYASTPPHMASHSQEQPASGTPSTPSSDPFTHGINSVSRPSPKAGLNPNSDFDVSFDMRTSMGGENVLPLLARDMEAWRTVLQDSRFFGIVDGPMESEGGWYRDLPFSLNFVP